MSEDNDKPELVLARWSHRFFAWLIDFIIISSISGFIISSIIGTITVDFYDQIFWEYSVNYFPTSLLFFAYWIILEYKTGQTIGKKILHLRITDMYGKSPDLQSIIISSFGKSFLLPFDVVLGWIFTNKNRQRIFNKIGDTIIIKINQMETDITYKKD